MNIDFAKLMSNKSDAGLQEYLNNISKYQPEAVEAAILEMQKRGKNFSDEDLNNIHNAITLKKVEIEKVKNDFSIVEKYENIVNDKNAPAYYSEKAILNFSIFFGVITGAILLTINAANRGLRNIALFTIAFGILYTSLEIWIIDIMNAKSMRYGGFTVGINLIGAMILNKVIWKRAFGDIKYRAKPVWTPLIICIIIIGLLLLVAFYNKEP